MTRLFPLQIFVDPKIRIYCFLTKIMCMSRHSLEKWAWSVLEFAYFNRDAWCTR